MARQVNLYEAKTHLSTLVEEAAAGEEIIIAKNGKALAKLIQVNPDGGVKMGLWRDLDIWIADDFDAPLPPEIQRYFDGEED